MSTFQGYWTIQSLSAWVTVLENKNQTLDTENAKLKSEIQVVKVKRKSVEHSFWEKLQTSIADLITGYDLQTKNKKNKLPEEEQDQQFTFPEDVTISNTFSARQDDPPNPSSCNSSAALNESVFDHTPTIINGNSYNPLTTFHNKITPQIKLICRTQSSINLLFK